MEKKNIKKIADSEDFYDLFDLKKEGADENNFEELLKLSEKDPELRKLQENKSNNNIDKKVISLKERIKLYPKPQEKYDLHGLTALEADSITEKFLNDSKNRGLKTVRVVTGKGHHSVSGSVLRDSVEKLANTLKKNGMILAWKWEKKYKEKSGSIIFYLL